ncbi:MAG: aminotransferase class I/II-fold pyridoxal phosphate-dependent enzyme [Deltaproteobacteria bacterium]|nr:aminotransferase class I/II-fold pyridoxal phosphate-dependent enzyme [Deltaproteobacteria bacterium]
MATAHDPHPFDDITEAELRLRQSAKWKLYPDDVLPAWVAEMDFPLAEPIRRVLHEAVDANDVGYADPRGLGDAFARFALREWGWAVTPSDVHTVADVVTGISELLRVVTEPGDGVVIEPPVYMPFASTIRQLGRTVVEAPLARAADGSYAVDLAAIERAYAAGARAHLLCSPHNPSGLIVPVDVLRAIAELADRYGVLVLSDEIHAPLALEPTHAPFPTVSAVAARRSIVLTSASKTWNLAGLKAAMMIAASPEARAVLAKLPPETPYHAGHLGILAARAAFTDPAADAWRQSVLAILRRNRMLLAELLSEHLPSVTYVIPRASYLAWIDCRTLGLGDDPAKSFLADGRVALSPGPPFGTGGAGHARLNVATTHDLLVEAVRRMAHAVKARG